MDIAPATRSPWRNLSFVWLVPILALAVSLGVAWKSYSDRGELIEITFLNASGVTKGETTLRYRDVVIGKVEDVGFTQDLSQVVVWARIDKDVAPFLDQGTEFWVVRPEVSARGITGLATVLSGVYIEGAWDDVVGVPLERFEGSEGPPLVQPGRAGKRVTLRSNDGGLLSQGAPVFFRGIEVGRIETPRLTVTGDSIIADAFIDAPHDRRLTTATRFWDTSGFSVTIGTGGLTVDVDSLSSLLAGGVEFDDIYDGGETVNAGYVFDIFIDESAARQSLVARSSDNAVTIAVPFGDSISGLAPGAQVRFGGLKVGEVTALSAQITETENGSELGLLANIAIEPNLLGLPPEAGADEVFDFLETAVAEGLRAQLGTASLFSSSLIVELVSLPDAEPAVFQRDADPLPILPSVASDLPDFTATAEGVLERINALPIEEMMGRAISLMASIEDLARAESTQAAPGAAVALLEDARAIFNDEATKALPSEIKGAVADLRAVVAELRAGGAIANISSALERASAAAANFATASEEVPALVEDLRALAAKANSLEAEELIAAATKMLASADALIGTDEARALPPALTGALNEIRGMIVELRDGGVVENANATMASARAAAESAASAAEALPALTERMSALARQAEGLVASYGARSDFNEETLNVLREMRSAARSIAELARTIERNPNSLLIGR